MTVSTDGDSIPVYVADSQKAALKRVELLIAELAEGFDYEQQDAIEKGEMDASEKYDTANPALRQQNKINSNRRGKYHDN